MTVQIHDVAQRSESWYALRAGRVGGSDAADVLATLKGKGEAASRRDLRTRLALEIVTGQVEPSGYINADMQRGIDMEPEARAAFEMRAGVLVQEVGYVICGERLGWSPDGFIGDPATCFEGLEIKVPRPARQLAYWRAGGIPSEHKAQLLHAFVVCPMLKTMTFVSYAPPLPIYIATVARSEWAADIAAYQTALDAFLVELDAEVAEIRRLMAAQGEQ